MAAVANNTVPNYDYSKQQLELYNKFLHTIKTHANTHEISVIIDDSCMNNIKMLHTNSTPAIDKQQWNDKLNVASVVVNVSSEYNPYGTNIYFLNDTPLYGMKNNEHFFDTIKETKKKRRGLCTIVDTLRRVYKEREAIGHHKLFIIITSNLPMNTNGNIDIMEFKKNIIDKPRNSNIIMLTCGKSPLVFQYWNNKIPNFEAYCFN